MLIHTVYFANFLLNEQFYLSKSNYFKVTSQNTREWFLGVFRFHIFLKGIYLLVFWNQFIHWEEGGLEYLCLYILFLIAGVKGTCRNKKWCKNVFLPISKCHLILILTFYFKKGVIFSVFIVIVNRALIFSNSHQTSNW